MRVAVISDLHLGAPPVPGAFGQDGRAFAAFVDGLLARHDRLVLNGDIVQTDHGLGWGRAARARALRRALAHHGWLAELLEDERVDYLIGNHDAVAHDELGAATERLLGDGQLVITHGDAFDPVIDRAPGISAAATWASGRLRRAGLVGLATHLEGRDVAIKGARFGGAAGPYAQGAAARMRATGARVCVLGHTHVPCQHALPEGIYANPGSSSLGWRAWVSVALGPTPAVTLHRARA